MSLVACALLFAMKQSSDYQTDLAQWRKDVETNLSKPGGWLTVAGLFWLEEGENTLGSKPGSKVLLPSYSGSSAEAGVLTRHAKKVSLDAKPGAEITVNGQAGTHFDLASDADGRPDSVQIGTVSFRIIVRGKRVGVRLFDSNCKAVKEFKGRHWYPAKPEFLIKAKFVPYNPPKTVQILNVLGDTEPAKVPGYVEFTVKGKKVRLDAQDEGDTLFFNFRDTTSGKETYPAGRFLNTPRPVNGEVTLDFNRAVNPPCAFTAYATCPLPPRSNILKVAIPAGELTHHPVH